MFYLEFNIRLFFYLLFKKTDIISAVDLDTILPSFLISKLKGKPCVYDAHEYFTEVPELIHRPMVRKVWLSLEEFIIPRLKYCYTVCESIATLFREKYGTEFITIRNAPVLIKTTAINENSGEPYLIYQGALNKGRGLEMLLSIMPELNIKLLIVGEGDLSNELRSMAKELKLNDKVEFLGYVAPVQLKEITRNAYLGINVSENLGLSYYYSLNNKCFDYMHAGLPAVTNDFPEYRSINDKFEIMLLVQPQKDELLKAIQKALTDKVLYQKLKANCVAAAAYYNWEKEEEKLLRFYGDVRK